MDRKNFYYRQIVGESDLDAAFDDVEQALQKLVVDQKITGIIGGFEISNATPYSVDVSAGVAFSKQLGRRMVYAGGTVDLTTDENNNPISLPLSNNGEVIVLSIFAEPTYVESDPRTDGNGNALNYVKTESMQLNVVAGTLGNTTGTPAPSVPALRSDQVLVADIVIYRSSGSDFIEVVQFGPAQYASIGVNNFQYRAEYQTFSLSGNVPGDAEQYPASLREVLQELANRVVAHHARYTVLPENGYYNRDKADFLDTGAHDVFDDVSRPGIHLSKVPYNGGPATYKPTTDVRMTNGQEFEGSSPDASQTVFDLDANNVKWRLNPEMSTTSSEGTGNGYKVKNATIYAPYSNYLVKTSTVPVYGKSGFRARAQFENVVLDPVNDPASTHDKLFFNVHNDADWTTMKWRISYDTILRNVSSKNANLVFGAVPSSDATPRTVVQDLDSGNLTIDSNGGYYSNIRLNGTDTTTPTLNITGDNNIIENVIISGASTNAPMIQISGRNNVVRNVILRGFGTHSTEVATRTSFAFLYFTPAAEQNSVENLFINGGVEAFKGNEQNLVMWSGSVTSDIADMAGQPLAYEVAFSASASSASSRADSNGETVCVVEVYARAPASTQSFRLLSSAGSGTSSGDFTVGSDWIRCRNLISGATSTTRLQNGSDGLARSVLFTKVQRWACTQMGDVNGIVFNGRGNEIRGLSVENLHQVNRALVQFVSGHNKLSNAAFDGISNLQANLVATVNGQSPLGVVDGLRCNNLYNPTSSEILVASDTSMHLKNVVIDQTSGYSSVNSVPVRISAGTSSGHSVIIEDSRFIGSKYGMHVTSGTTPVVLNRVYSASNTGGGTTADAGGAGIFFGDTNSAASLIEGGCDSVHLRECTFYAVNGRAAAIVNTSGSIEGCTFIGGTGSPGSGVQLLTVLPRVQDSTLSNRLPLFMTNNLARWNSSNVNTGASTDEPMVTLGGLENYTYHPGSSLFVDGLLVMPDDNTLPLSVNTVVLGVQSTDDEHSYFHNIVVDLQGCPANNAGTKPVVVFGPSSNFQDSPYPVVLQSDYTNAALSHINVSNLSIRGVQTGTAVQARNILELYRTKADNVEILANNSAQTANGFTNMVGLFGSIVSKLTCGWVTHSGSTVYLDTSPSALSQCFITGSTAVLRSEYILHVAAAAAGSILSDIQLESSVTSQAPVYTKAAIYLPGSDRSTVLSNVSVKHDNTAMTAIRPMIIMGDAPNRILGCEFDFNFGRSGTGDNISGTAPVMTLTDSAANFQVDEVGQYITITGASNTRNNGRFLIVNRVSNTAIQYINPYGANEAFAGTWYIVPEMITNAKSGTGDTIGASGTVMTLTDAAGLFSPNDVGKKLYLFGATTNSNNGEFIVTSYVSATQIQYRSLQGNDLGPAEAFPGTWMIVGTKSTIQGCTFRNRSTTYSSLPINVSYVGMQKETSIPLPLGQPVVSPVGSTTTPAGGSTDGSVPGYFFYPTAGYPIWVTLHTGQAVVFPLKLPENSVLIAVDVVCQKAGVLVSTTSLNVLGYNGASYFVTASGSTQVATGVYFVCARGINHKVLDYSQYVIRVDSGFAGSSSPETIKNILVSYFDPQTNRIW